MNDKIDLTIYDNAISFANEAIENSTRAINDASRWKFSIINIVQSLELFLKEILRHEHPVLIYTDVDKQENTVSLVQAMGRIEKVTQHRILEADKKQIKAIQQLRNKIMHSEVSFTPAHANVLFIQAVFFINHFCKVHLNRDFFEDITLENKSFMFQNKENLKKLLIKAKEHFDEMGYSNDDIIYCPDCGICAFIVKDEKDKCYLCHYEEKLKECEHCGERNFEAEFTDISKLFDYSNEGSIYQLEDDYEYDFNEVCVFCFDEIEGEIRERKKDRDLELFTLFNHEKG